MARQDKSIIALYSDIGTLFNFFNLIYSTLANVGYFSLFAVLNLIFMIFYINIHICWVTTNLLKLIEMTFIFNCIKYFFNLNIVNVNKILLIRGMQHLFSLFDNVSRLNWPNRNLGHSMSRGIFFWTRRIVLRDLILKEEVLTCFHNFFFKYLGLNLQSKYAVNVQYIW